LQSCTWAKDGNAHDFATGKQGLRGGVCLQLLLIASKELKVFIFVNLNLSDLSHTHFLRLDT
jgi:hypothetical protein